MKRQKIVSYMDQLWNHKNLKVVDEIFSADAIIHSTLGERKSVRQMKEVFQTWFNAIPDIHVNQIHTIEEDDRVISHWKASGTHRGELMGISPSGNSVAYQGVTIYRFEGDQIGEYWAYLDVVGLQKQLENSN